MQILPAIDIRGGRCVRLRQGDYQRETVFAADPVAVARRWAADGAERLHLVDLDGARAGRPVNHKLVQHITSEVGIPCQLGGGIRDETAIRTILDEIRVDRVIVGTGALQSPDWFVSMVRLFPRRIALGLDARDSMVATDGWLEVSTMPALELARQFAGLPLAAVVYTNIANDGMMQGVDEATLRDLKQLAGFGLPVIASGGVSSIDDVRRLREISVEHPGLVGAIIGRAIYEGAISVAEAVHAASGVS